MFIQKQLALKNQRKNLAKNSFNFTAKTILVQIKLAVNHKITCTEKKKYRRLYVCIYTYAHLSLPNHTLIHKYKCKK